MGQFDSKGNVHSLETFGTVDGPGIRFVVFMQGCPLQCQYCHNRDTWGNDVNKSMSVADVLCEYNKYKDFYRNGGLTVSGGEPLFQIDFIIELFKEAKKLHINTCLDTSGGYITDIDKVKTLLKYTDHVLLDIKHIDNNEHIKLTGIENEKILEFGRLLSRIKIDTTIKYVLIPGINSNKEYLVRLREYLNSLNNICNIEVNAYHKEGIKKWILLKKAYPLENIEIPTKQEMMNAIEILTKDYRYKTTSN